MVVAEQALMPAEVARLQAEGVEGLARAVEQLAPQRAAHGALLVAAEVVATVSRAAGLAVGQLT